MTTIKSIVRPSGLTARLGRRPPVALPPQLPLRRYISRSTIPTAPSVLSYRKPARSGLGEVYLNDTLGDCVIAQMGHGSNVWEGMGGKPIDRYSNTQITALYSAIGGYVPGDPSTDQGCVITTALDYWRATGMPDGYKIAGYVTVDNTNLGEVRDAIWLFGWLTMGLDLPDAWLQAKMWDYTRQTPPDPANGHCIGSCKYDADNIYVETWGESIPMNNAAVENILLPRYGGETYVAINQEIINVASYAKAKNGFDWEQLVADFNAMGGNLQVPT